MGIQSNPIRGKISLKFLFSFKVKKEALLRKTLSLTLASLLLTMPLMTSIGSAQTQMAQGEESAQKELPQLFVDVISSQILADWNRLPLPFRTEYMMKAFRTILDNPLFPLASEFREEVAAVLKLHDFIEQGSEIDVVKNEVLAKQQKLDALLKSNDILKDIIPASDTAPPTNTPDLIESALELSPEQRSILFSMAWDKIIVDTNDRLINGIEKLTNIIPALTPEQLAALEDALGQDLENLEVSVSTIIQASGAQIGLQGNNFSPASSLTKTLMSAADLLSALIERPAFAFEFRLPLVKPTITFNPEVFKAEVRQNLEVFVFVSGVYLTAAATFGGSVAGAVAVARSRPGHLGRIVNAIPNAIAKFQRAIIKFQYNRQTAGHYVSPSGRVHPPFTGRPLTREQQNQFYERINAEGRARLDLKIKIAKEFEADRARIIRQAAQPARVPTTPVRIPTQAEPAPADVVRGAPPPGWSQTGFDLVIKGANRGTGGTLSASLPALALPAAIGLVVPGRPDTGVAGGGAPSSPPSQTPPRVQLPGQTPTGSPGTGSTGLPSAGLGGAADNRPPIDRSGETPSSGGLGAGTAGVGTGGAGIDSGSGSIGGTAGGESSQVATLFPVTSGGVTTFTQTNEQGVSTPGLTPTNNPPPEADTKEKEEAQVAANPPPPPPPPPPPEEKPEAPPEVQNDGPTEAERLARAQQDLIMRMVQKVFQRTPEKALPTGGAATRPKQEGSDPVTGTKGGGSFVDPPEDSIKGGPLVAVRSPVNKPNVINAGTPIEQSGNFTGTRNIELEDSLREDLRGPEVTATTPGQTVTTASAAPGTCSPGLVATAIATNQYSCVAPPRECTSAGFERTICSDEKIKSAFSILSGNININSAGTAFTEKSGIKLCQEGYTFVSGYISSSESFGYYCNGI